MQAPHVVCCLHASDSELARSITSARTHTHFTNWANWDTTFILFDRIIEFRRGTDFKTLDRDVDMKRTKTRFKTGDIFTWVVQRKRQEIILFAFTFRRVARPRDKWLCSPCRFASHSIILISGHLMVSLSIKCSGRCTCHLNSMGNESNDAHNV